MLPAWDMDACMGSCRLCMGEPGVEGMPCWEATAATTDSLHSRMSQAWGQLFMYVPVGHEGHHMLWLTQVEGYRLQRWCHARSEVMQNQRSNM